MRVALVVLLGVSAGASEVCRYHEGKKLRAPCGGAENMCDCSGFAASAFDPSLRVYASSGVGELEGHAEGTCGYANLACDLKWSVLCCDSGELAPLGESEFQPKEEERRGLQATFETAEDFCERNGYTLTGTYEMDRVAYPGEGFVGFTGYLDGTCGNVLADSLSQYANCCCADEAYCCPDGEDADDCLSKVDIPSNGGGSGSYSYSFSYDSLDVGPQYMCPSMDDLDLSVCYENGVKDDDCCARAEEASCAEGYVLDQSDPAACDDAGSVQTCCYNNCPDSTSWYKNGDPSKDCDWVAKLAPQRCDAKGVDRTYASYSCPQACSTTCHDSTSWYKTDDTSKNCAWVSAFPEKRCDTKGADGTLASYSCPSACGLDVMAQDSDDWYKNGDTSKDCSWVANFASARCDTVGWDGSLASDACLRACEEVNVAA